MPGIWEAYEACKLLTARGQEITAANVRAIVPEVTPGEVAEGIEEYLLMRARAEASMGQRRAV